MSLGRSELLNWYLGENSRLAVAFVLPCRFATQAGAETVAGSFWSILAFGLQGIWSGWAISCLDSIASALKRSLTSVQRSRLRNLLLNSCESKYTWTTLLQIWSLCPQAILGSSSRVLVHRMGTRGQVATRLPVPRLKESTFPAF